MDFTRLDWEIDLRRRVAEQGRVGLPYGIDYFVFTNGLWDDIPPFAIGRTLWDNWLIYRARARGAPVIDATQVITVIHQNHGFTHIIAPGCDGNCKGAEAVRNRELAGTWSHVFTLLDATHLLTPKGLRPALTKDHIRWRMDILQTTQPTIGRFMRICYLLLNLIRRAFRKVARLWANLSGET